MRPSRVDEKSNENNDSCLHQRDNNSGIIIMERISETNKIVDIPCSVKETVLPIRLDTFDNPTSSARHASVRIVSLRNQNDDPAFNIMQRRSNTDFSSFREQNTRDLSGYSTPVCIALESINQDKYTSSEDGTDHSHSKEFGPVQEPRTLYFSLRVIYRFVTRIGDMGTDIWVLYTAYVTEGEEDFFL